MSQLHPSVEAFKAFVNRHPKLLQEIRRSGRGWQEYYEKWALLEEDDPYWDAFKSESRAPETSEEKKETKSSKKDHSDLIQQIMHYTRNLDAEKMQGQVEQLSSAIGTIQEMLDDFRKTTKKQGPKNPFQMRRD